MVHFLAATDSTDTSERLVNYLSGRLGPDDQVTAVNSLRGGDATKQDAITAGREALDVVADGLDCEVDTHQLVRGNDPVTDVLEQADDSGADELVIGIKKRNPTGKVIFGSTAQDILLKSDRPVICVPPR
jgi:nucleotide-binding universal stress UspA family protein